uniref:DUF1618 domain-containing protein n=1 Tax=Oryza punctata TaxID=4537 RepID=A0A0E0MD12_ORYPU
METQPTDGRGGGGAAAGYPRWLILEREAEYMHADYPCSAAADAKTEAATLSSGGHIVRVSLDLRAPPAASCVCCTCSLPIDLALGWSDAPKEAEFLVLRSGEWSVVRAPIIHDDGKAEELSFWETDMVVPVGDRWLCWVDLYRGVILCDMFDDVDETLRPRYLSLPIDAPAGKFDNDRRRCQMPKRRVCVTNGGTVEVNSFPEVTSPLSNSCVYS